MVIMTAKVSKRKVIAIVLVAVLAILLVSILLSNSGEAAQPQAEQIAAQSQTQEQTPKKIKTNEDRVAYLRSYGWDVDDEPVQTQEVRVPTDPNEVFQRYNELQKSQGFDLDQYAGKTVKRYVYEIENYPGAADDDDYFATLLIYKDEVIGGDVCAAKKGGVMHGLAMPQNTAAADTDMTATVQTED